MANLNKRISQHKLIVDKLNCVETWKDEKGFIADALTMTTSELFIKSFSELKQNNF